MEKLLKSFSSEWGWTTGAPQRGGKYYEDLDLILFSFEIYFG